MPDRRLAQELARVLDGTPTTAAEAERLAALLRGAADVARFDVPDDEVQRRLGALRPTRPLVRRRHPRRPRLVAAALLAVAVAVVAAALLLRGGAPGVDVGGQALAAVASRPGVLLVNEEVRLGRQAAQRQVMWTDRRGDRVRLERLDQFGRPALEVVAVPGHYVRYDVGAGTAVVASSCNAVASGCAELVDPIGFYRAALQRSAVRDIAQITFHDAPAYVFTVPVQTAPGGTRVEQRVIVDAASFLPRRIEWRDRTGTVASIRVDGIAHETADAATFTIDLPENVRTRQIDGTGHTVRILSRRAVSQREARRAVTAARWLGPQALVRITLLQLTGGVAVRADYQNGVSVWSYAGRVPPPLIEAALAPGKVVDENNTIVHFSSAHGLLIAERDLPGLAVAVTAPHLSKADLLSTALHLRRM
jgi:hypothetical protein